jgi:uncharacterized membrane protein YbhN (UPF0104 family)
MTSVVLAHLVCAALVTIDLLARTCRLRWLVAGAGHSMRNIDALRSNLLADAGAAISPMRLAGEPARLAGMRLAGVPLTMTLAAIGWELVTAWPTLLLLSGVLFVFCAPEWWATNATHLLDTVREATPALGLIAVLTLVAFGLAQGIQRTFPPAVQAKRPRWRTMPVAPLLASVVLSAVNVAARTAMLPALAMALPDPPSAAPLWLGSFLLVYGQLFFPTPAGLGAVEFAYVGGAAGDLGGDLGLLLAWRWWSNLLPAILGLLVAWGFRHRLRRLRSNTS